MNGTASLEEMGVEELAEALRQAQLSLEDVEEVQVHRSTCGTQMCKNADCAD